MITSLEVPIPTRQNQFEFLHFLLRKCNTGVSFKTKAENPLFHFNYKISLKNA